MFISFVIGIVGFGIVFYSKYGNPTNKYKTLKIGLILFGQTFLSFIIGIALTGILESQARQELIDFLNQPNLNVEINGIPLDTNYSRQIVSDLRAIRNMAAHHSSPTKKIEVRIRSNKHQVINLNIQQDSQVKNEYWIFWDKYRSTDEIGRIRTKDSINATFE